MIASSKLIDLFKQAANERWGYIWGASGETWTQKDQNKATRDMTMKYGQQWVGKRVADCSGLFVWAFKELGESIYHGSNTIWRSHLSSKGTLSKDKRTDGKDLKPGTAVFQMKKDASQDDGEDQSHIGLYIGDGLVVEAWSTQKGVKYTKLADRDWEQWGELKKVDYGDVSNTGGNKMTETILYYAVVTASNGLPVNFRTAPANGASRVTRCPKIGTGTKVGIISSDGTWSKIRYGDHIGYMMDKFLKKESEDNSTVTPDSNIIERLEDVEKRLDLAEQRLAKLDGGLG